MCVGNSLLSHENQTGDVLKPVNRYIINQNICGFYTHIFWEQVVEDPEKQK